MEGGQNRGGGDALGFVEVAEVGFRIGHGVHDHGKVPVDLRRLDQAPQARGFAKDAGAGDDGGEEIEVVTGEEPVHVGQGVGRHDGEVVAGPGHLA